MKKLLFLIPILSLFSSCEKDKNTSPLEGFWYIRTFIEQVSVGQEIVNQTYKLYKREDISNRYFTSFTFNNNQLIIEKYDRDRDLNVNTITKTEYKYRLSGQDMYLIDNEGKEKVYKFAFVGLGSKSLRLDFFDKLIDKNNDQLSLQNRTLLIRKFPKDDSEETKEEMGHIDLGSGPQ